MNKVLREEKKFLISLGEFIAKSHALDKIMIPDSHNGTHGYIDMTKIRLVRAKKIE